ncbi:MAG: hypothetical protein IKQ10_00295 [Oscillospiraceae bacterium]|nr:hypothetical protein [Oscillospiraceae bacterium]
MSDLRPQRRALLLGGEQHELLFSLAAVDEVQSSLNLPIFDAIRAIFAVADGKVTEKGLEILAGVLAALLRTNGEPGATALGVIRQLKPETLTGTALQVAALFTEDAPEADDEDAAKESSSAVNVARLLYTCTSVLRLSEADVWEMTLRKIYLLIDEHLIANGKKKETDIDSVAMFAG